MRLDVGGWKLEVRGSRLEVRGWRLEVRGSRLEELLLKIDGLIPVEIKRFITCSYRINQQAASNVLRTSYFVLRTSYFLLRTCTIKYENR
jgi:hypothetical protein